MFYICKCSHSSGILYQNEKKYKKQASLFVYLGNLHIFAIELNL